MPPSLAIEDKAELESGVVAGSPVKDADPDAKYGGHDARLALERKLLRKLDIRMSVLILVYILNYASRLLSQGSKEH